MKQILLFACLLTTATAAEPPAAQDQQMLQVIQEIQAQQIAMAENQAKIEEKIAAAAEAIRVARIYSSRSGH